MAVVYLSQHHQKFKTENDIFPLCVCHFPYALLGRSLDGLKWVYTLQYLVESLSCMATTRYRGIVSRHSWVDSLHSVEGCVSGGYHRRAGAGLFFCRLAFTWTLTVWIPGSWQQQLISMPTLSGLSLRTGREAALGAAFSALEEGGLNDDPGTRKHSPLCCNHDTIWLCKRRALSWEAASRGRKSKRLKLMH